jgi:UDP-N-acetylmuramoyl-tripeptide--D-alanyl-D-alanine ligase
MASRTSAEVTTYGFDPGADFTAGRTDSAGSDGMRFELITPAGRQEIGIPTLGRMAVHNALAAAAVGEAAGLSLDEIASGLGRGWGAPHRAQLIRAGGLTIVDDSYNASPASVLAALELLGGLPGRRIAVLGEMLELGEAHEHGHRSVGEGAAATVDRLIVVGDGAAAIVDGARAAGLDEGQIARVPDREAALDAVLVTHRPGDVVLIKASRGIELDRLVDDLVITLGGRTS